MSTKECLAQVLHAHRLFDLEKRARTGEFDDYESEHATPIVNLVMLLQARGHVDLAERAKNGEWDGTKEEADEWYKKDFPEGLK